MVELITKDAQDSLFNLEKWSVYEQKTDLN